MTDQAYKIRSRWPRRIAVVVLLACVAALIQWSRARVTETNRTLGEQIDAIVEAAMEEGPIAGLSVGVARGGETLHLAGYGYGDLENELPATGETVYGIGSLTKQFTASMILRLEEEGLLDLDDPIAQHLPYGPDYAGPATLRSLLNHTAGIKNYTTMETWWRTIGVEMTPEEMAAVFRDEPPDFAPGTNFSYSNSGYVLLGWIIERVSGQPYGGYLNEHIATPLGLASTSYCDRSRLVPNRARGYAVEDEEFRHAQFVSMSQAYAAGGLCSNVPDLLLWSRALARGAVVRPASYEVMSQTSRLADGTPIEYGLGLAVGYLEGRPRITHVGGMLGFSSFLASYPEDDLRIVVLSNTEGARVAGVEQAIARLLLDLGEREVGTVALSSEELGSYVGLYDMSLAEVEVTVDGDRLIAEIGVPGLEGRYALVPRGDHAFEVEDDSETRATFLVADGRATGFTLNHQGITLRGRRLE